MHGDLARRRGQTRRAGRGAAATEAQPRRRYRDQVVPGGGSVKVQYSLVNMLPGRGIYLDINVI